MKLTGSDRPIGSDPVVRGQFLRPGRGTGVGLQSPVIRGDVDQTTIAPRNHRRHEHTHQNRIIQTPRCRLGEPATASPAAVTRPKTDNGFKDWTTWWLWRGARTRSLPELGRENPQRPWYCVSRHGRVGRRQVFQSTRCETRRTLVRRWASNVPGPRIKSGDDPGTCTRTGAGWSSPVARQAHNLKAAGSNPVPATR